MMTQMEFEKWYQENEQAGCCLARLDKVAACNLCYTIGFLQSEYQDNKAPNHGRSKEETPCQEKNTHYQEL
jgi:hypothetical protein